MGTRNGRNFIACILLIGTIFLLNIRETTAQNNGSIKKSTATNCVEDLPTMKNLNYIAHKLTNEVKPPATLEELKKNRTKLRKQVLRIIGLDPMPEKTPLNIKLVGEKLDLGDCYFQRVVYESRPHIYVAAHLYIPKDVTFPVPAIIHVPGHSRRDKNRAHPRTYAANGFVAIALPMVGEEGKRGAGWGPCGEYGPYMGHFNWYNTGYTTIAPTVWDGIRTVDFLLTLTDNQGTKLVNADKIGMAGLSGGSGRTLWTVIADPRISVAVVNQGLTTIEGYNSPISGVSSTCDIHLFYNYYGLSYKEIYSLIAPRKFLLQHGTEDILYPNPQSVVDYLKSIYALYDASDSFNFVTHHQGHGYSPAIWNTENSWMDRWLRNGDKPLTISDKFDTELTCFPDGEPSDMVHVETAFTPPTPAWTITSHADLKTYKNSLLKAMKTEIIRTAFLPIDSQMKTLTSKHSSTYTVAEKELSINNRAICHRGYYLYKAGEKRKTIILIANEIIDLATLTALFENSYLPNGFNLFCLEITGTGSNPWVADRHFLLSRFGEICGQTLASLQINDLLAAIKHLKQDPTVDTDQLFLWGSENSAVPALYAAVVAETDIAGVVLSDAPDRHIGITSTMETNDKIALFRILNYADIPQVAGLIYPRTLILNGKHKSGFSWTADMYKTLGKAEHFIEMNGKDAKVIKELNTVTVTQK